MKRIALTQGKFALVDNNDFERVSKIKWHATWSPQGRCFYACGYKSYRKPKGEKAGRIIKMHRFLKGLKDGDKRIIDHINHDTLDNRQKNLRIVTIGQNQWNTVKPITNTSGFKGVCWHKTYKKWRAQISHKGKYIYLGNFKSKIKASKAYQEAAKKLRGKFYVKR